MTDYPAIAWIVNVATGGVPSLHLVTEPDIARGFDDKQLVISAAEALHPTQIRVIEFIATEGGCWSPNGMREILDEPLGNVSYHVKELAKAGVLVLEKTEPRRGAVEHFYRLADL
jgi:DNA-binding MarR family transcriptional regulator